MQSEPILIIGGKGKTGRRVDALLREKGLMTRPASRSTSPLFDWTRPDTWPAAVEGARKAYVTFQPDLAIEGADRAIAHLCELAITAGMEHIVLLSGRGEPGAQRAEAVLQESGLPWTIVRASWFSQNFSENFLLYSILHGELALPVGNVPEPFVDADDIAEIVVRALTEEGHRQRLYEVTGPRALTFAEAAAEIADATDRPIRFRQITADFFTSQLRHEGVPEDVIALLDRLFTEVLDGRNSTVTRGVEEALGRPPRDFTDYVRNVATSGVWNMKP